MIPKRVLGATGVEVTCLGLGGEGVLRSFGRQAEAEAVIARALDLGISYFESARAYSGSEAYYGLALGARRREIFLASKSHARTAEGADQQLASTLAEMRTGWLDLWQVHDLRSDSDLVQVFGPGGAIEAFDRAKQEGRVRFVGVTGHQDPAILLKAFALYPFDTVLLPVNPAEAAHGGFIDTVLPEARRRNMGVVGMKVLCRGLGLGVPGYATVEPWIRYALAQAVSTLVVACDDPRQVEENVVAAAAPPLPAAACRVMAAAVAPCARQLMLYK